MERSILRHNLKHEYMQDGHLTIRIPISNDDGTRSVTEEIRVGMAITSTVRYPDYQIEYNTQATVRIQPFGGYIQFDKSVVSLSESSESSTDECDLVVQRLNGKGGESSAVIKLITISDAGEGNVCSETTSNDLNLNKDLNLASPYFNLTWSDQDDSDRCLNFDVVDDTIVRGRRSDLRTHRTRRRNSSNLNKPYAVLTVKDNDKASDYTVIISVSIVAFVFITFGVVLYIRRQIMISKYIKIKYAVEVSKCRYVTFLSLFL